jgi:hypothetical protein
LMDDFDPACANPPRSGNTRTHTDANRCGFRMTLVRDTSTLNFSVATVPHFTVKFVPFPIAS